MHSLIYVKQNVREQVDDTKKEVAMLTQKIAEQQKLDRKLKGKSPCIYVVGV